MDQHDAVFAALADRTRRQMLDRLFDSPGLTLNDLVANLGMARQSASRHLKVLEAAGLRLRPILMTTFATVLGVVPLLLAFGAGANARFAIGLMIAAGMLVGTLFTLFVIPVFYLPFTRRGMQPVQADDYEDPAAAISGGTP